MTDLYLKMPEKDQVKCDQPSWVRKKKTRTPLYEDDDQSDNKEMEPDQHTGAVCQVNEIKKQLRKR